MVEDEEANSIAFSPDGNTIASAGEGGEIHLWTMPKRENISKRSRPMTYGQSTA